MVISRTQLLGLIGISGLIGSGMGIWLGTRSVTGNSTAVSATPTIQQVQALASLITQRIEVSDVEETAIEGRTGGIKAALLIKGDVLLGTDLSTARFEAVDPAARRAILVLVQPRITSPRLDQDRTRLFAMTQSGLWAVLPEDRSVTTALVNRAYTDAQRRVAAAGDDPRLTQASEAQAELVLSTFFRTVGWEVTVRWAN
jgi:Protein of unknown function (DUF4230)